MLLSGQNSPPTRGGSFFMKQRLVQHMDANQVCVLIGRWGVLDGILAPQQCGVKTIADLCTQCKGGVGPSAPLERECNAGVLLFRVGYWAKQFRKILSSLHGQCVSLPPDARRSGGHFAWRHALCVEEDAGEQLHAVLPRRRGGGGEVTAICYGNI